MSAVMTYFNFVQYIVLKIRIIYNLKKHNFSNSLNFEIKKIIPTQKIEHDKYPVVHISIH